MANSEANFLSEYSRFLDSSGQHLTYMTLSLYLNFADELSEKEKHFLKTHIDSCADCLIRLSEVEEAEQEEKRKQQMPAQRKMPTTFKYAIAASFVVVIGAAILFYVMKQPPEKVISQEAPAEKSIAALSDPAGFVPNQALENFIQRTVRSSSLVSLISPSIGDTLAVPITFKWEGTKKGESVTLTIVDNSNAEVWTSAVSSSEIVFERTLEPGLYYVKLEVNEKLVSVGKFAVVK